MISAGNPSPSVPVINAIRPDAGTLRISTSPAGESPQTEKPLAVRAARIWAVVPLRA